MSLNLYQNLSSGSGRKTLGIPIGNGPSFQTDDLSPFEVEGHLSSVFPFVDAYKVHDVNSSNEMSSYLLNTNANNAHPSRLGSYIVGDRINLNLNLNEDSIWKLLTNSDLANSDLWGLMIDSFVMESTQRLERTLSNRKLEALDPFHKLLSDWFL
jgi:hypothetical protein